MLAVLGTLVPAGAALGSTGAAVYHSTNIPATPTDAPVVTSASPSAGLGGQVFNTANPADQPLVDGYLAVILPDGTAAAPSLAPAAVQNAIWAANKIIGKPYRYGGGHRSFRTIASGYDCSGAVSQLLHGGDLLNTPMDSVDLASWGQSGKGDWITVYTNPSHAYVEIAGVRLDTSAAGDLSNEKGPRWRPLLKSSKGYKKRHPVGL
jgi:cell wall-associated NlpC family hydrolase